MQCAIGLAAMCADTTIPEHHREMPEGTVVQILVDSVIGDTMQYGQIVGFDTEKGEHIVQYISADEDGVYSFEDVTYLVPVEAVNDYEIVKKGKRGKAWRAMGFVYNSACDIVRCSDVSDEEDDEEWLPDGNEESDDDDDDADDDDEEEEEEDEEEEDEEEEEEEDEEEEEEDTDSENEEGEEDDDGGLARDAEYRDGLQGEDVTDAEVKGVPAREKDGVGGETNVKKCVKKRRADDCL